MTLERIRQGDPKALEELLQECWAPLVRHLTSLVGAPEAAQDAAQEAFVRLWARREEWRDGSARALVYRMARNAALDQRRREKVRLRFAEETSTAAPSAPAPDQHLERTELRLRLESALGRLAPRRREAFELVRFAGLSHAEVAEVMDLSPQTVANHLSLALRDLRSELSDLLEPGAGHGPEARSHDG